MDNPSLGSSRRKTIGATGRTAIGNVTNKFNNIFRRSSLRSNSSATSSTAGNGTSIFATSSPLLNHITPEDESVHAHSAQSMTYDGLKAHASKPNLSLSSGDRHTVGSTELRQHSSGNMYESSLDERTSNNTSGIPSVRSTQSASSPAICFPTENQSVDHNTDSSAKDLPLFNAQSPPPGPAAVITQPKASQTLFEQGVRHLSPEGGQSPSQAFAKFDQAVRRAPVPGHPCYDWYSHASCLNNMAVAKRQVSQFDDALVKIQEAWGVAVGAVVQEKKRHMAMGEEPENIWMEFVVVSLALHQDAIWISAMQEPSATTAEANDDGIAASNTSGSSEHHNSEQTSILDKNFKILHGPPIVALFLDLTTNMGNILYNAGYITESFLQHSNCLRLSESVVEVYPVDAEFRMAFPLSIPSRFSRTMAGGILSNLFAEKREGQQPTPATTFQYDPNMPAPPSNRRLHLSYLHRVVILAQTRSLTHLAVCCQGLGLEDAALQCNSHAHEILTFYRKFGVIGGVFEGTEVVRHESEETPNAAVVRVKTKKRPKRDEQLKWQEMQTEKTETYMRDTFELLQAGVSANLALSFYIKGRFGSAMEYLVHSSGISKRLGYTLQHTRALSSIHALKIDLGRSLKALHWVRNMETEAAGATELDEFSRYWGPPRISGINVDPSSSYPDTFAPASIGASWIDPGIRGLKSCLQIFREKDDLFNVLLTLVNLATGYIINGQPYIALYILGSMMNEQTASGLSLSKMTDDDEGSGKMPQGLKLHTHFTLCQAVFLVLRLQNPNEELFPRFIDITPDTLLCCYPEPINALIEAMGLRIDNFLDLEMLCVGFVTAVQGLEITRHRIMTDMSYAMLHINYIGDDGYFGASAHSMNLPSFDPQRGLSEQVLGSHVYGIGTGIDFYTQQSLLIRLLMGKNDWLKASNNHSREGQGMSGLYLNQAAQNLDSMVHDALELFRAGSGEPTKTNVGMIGNLHESSVAALGIPAMSSKDVQDKVEATAEKFSGAMSKLTAAMQTSMFTCPTLFAMSADLLSHGAFQVLFQKHISQHSVSAEVHNVLRMPATPSPGRIHRDLLSAAAAAHCGGLAMCEACMRTVFNDPDSYGQLVFVSTEGAIVAADPHGVETVFGGVTDPDGSIAAKRNGVDLKGCHMFPCQHYYV
ncbi:hypothetical protein HDU77_000132 [Chytriomyces hyalinus]|nr:hypothetical protein HDU77_000132 [Chytriomyces hyalinus]